MPPSPERELAHAARCGPALAERGRPLHRGTMGVTTRIVDTPSPNAYAMENSLKRYGVDRWGAEIVGVNDAGHLLFRAPKLPPVDLHEMALFLEKRGIRTPFVARFPTMIHGQMERLKKAFDASI